MNMHFLMNKLNKMSIPNTTKHHSYFYSVWYGEDTIMGLYFILFYFISILCDIVSLFLKY